MSSEYNIGIIAALGTLFGVVVSQILEIIRQNLGFRKQQKGKIIDRRIDAHESALNLADTMMTVVMPETAEYFSDKLERPVRGVAVLNNKSIFENWWAETYYSCYKKHVWLSPKCLKELNFIQDYIVNLSIIMSNLDEKKVEELSVLVRPDFIEMSGRLRGGAITYLSQGAIKFKLKDLNGLHKYDRAVSEKRLNETQLIKEYSSYLN